MINNGGPAFPTVPEGMPIADIAGNLRTSGMSLRDWFAGQALIGNIARVPRCYVTLAELAAECYAVADAMLAERQ